MSTNPHTKHQKYAREDYEQIFDNLPDPIFVTDRDGNVLLSNSTTALTLDISLGQLLKSNVKDLVKGGYYNTSYAVKAVETKKVVSGILKTKLNMDYISTSTPVLDENGEVRLVISSARPKEIMEKFANDDVDPAADQRKREIDYLRSYVFNSSEVIAESKLMQRTLLTTNSVAQTDSTVVLYGETGTGKEVLAKYVHQHSKRNNESFIAVNCAALPENLFESELFGYEKGSFTGANNHGKIGLFEAADGGTLFLDEIAELTLALQSKLLRVLETGGVRRIGSHIERNVDFRLIAATHKDLKKMVDEGTFRADLYYRINVIPITIPPLRERPEDIIALSLKFLETYNKKYGSDIKLGPELIDWMQKYNWPGNVRELKNVIERTVITNLHTHSTDHLSLISQMPGNYSANNEFLNLMEFDGPLKDVVKKVEEIYIKKVLKECNGKVGEAANKLGIYRTVVYRKLKEFESSKSTSET